MITFARPADYSRTLAKIVHIDPMAEWPHITAVTPAPNVTAHAFRTEPVENLSDLVGALRRAADAGEIAVRGEPVAAVGRRAIYDHPEKGPAGLRVVPRRWVGFDWDSLPLKPDDRPELDDDEGWAAWHEPDALLDPEIGVRQALRFLPPAFREVDCVWQISASAGFKPGFRLRTWHLLDKPVTGADMKLWCAPIIKRHILDPVTLVEAQPHYLAAHVVGGSDPCPQRFGIYRQDGVEEVEVIDIELMRERERRKAIDLIRSSIPPKYAHSGNAAERYIEGCIDRIMRAPDGSKHPTYVAELARAKNVAGSAGLDWSAISRRMRDTYESTLTPDEANRRRSGSTDGALRWINGRASA